MLDNVFLPDANAVPAEAESVIIEPKSCVFARPSTGN
jgi:hypothetical protein